MKFRHFKYYISEVFKSIVRNRIMSLTSIVTVVACMIILSFAYVITSNANFAIEYLETTVGITVFIEDEVDDAGITRIEAQLLALSNVAEIQFISPEEALLSLAYSLGDTGGDILVGLVYENPLRREYALTLRNARIQNETVEQLWNIEGIGNVNSSSQTVESIISASDSLNLFSIISILALAILSIIIITNTIRLTVNNRKNEITIMKYVGATEWFIKWPFVIEGIIIGLFGSIIALTAVWFSYDIVVDYFYYIVFSIIFQFVEIPSLAASDVFPFLVPIVVILGCLIGFLGSMASMRRYLSV